MPRRRHGKKGGRRRREGEAGELGLGRGGASKHEGLAMSGEGGRKGLYQVGQGRRTPTPEASIEF